MRSAVASYLLLSIAVACFGAIPAFADEACRPQQLASLHLSAGANGSVSIPATLNGRTVTLVVDTGSSIGMLDAASAKDLDLEISRSRSWLSLPGGINTSLFAEVDSVQLTTLPAFQSKFAIIPPDANGGEKVLNIGADALSKYDIEIDFAGSRLNLYSPDRCIGRILQLNGELLAAVQMQSDRGLHIVVPITLDGKPMTAVLDSGALRTVMSLETAQAVFGLDNNNAELSAEAPTSLNGGTVSAPFRYPFKSLNIAGVTVANPNIQLLPESALVSDGPQILLGLDVLRRLHIYVAYADQYLYVGRSTAP